MDLKLKMAFSYQPLVSMEAHIILQVFSVKLLLFKNPFSLKHLISAIEFCLAKNNQCFPYSVLDLETFLAYKC